MSECASAVLVQNLDLIRETAQTVADLALSQS